MTKTARTIDRAMTLAAEYVRLVRDGRLPEADQAARTINELVGRWSGHRWTLPRAVRDRMAASR